MHYFKFFIVIAIIAIANSIRSQIFNEGSIITLENDTISGYVKDISGLKNLKVCKFKENKKGKVKRYSPEELNGYFFHSDKRYQSLKVFHRNEYKSSFVEVLLEGQVNLFHDRKSNYLAFYIQKKGEDLIGLENDEITVGEPSSNGVPIYWREYNVAYRIYKDTLEVFFNDNEEILRNLRYLEYNNKALLTLTREYVKLTCSGDQCITYEKDLKLSKPKFGVYTGVQASVISLDNDGIESDYTLNVPFGIYYKLPVSVWLEGLYFQPELLLNVIRFKDGFDNPLSTIYNYHVDYNRIAIPLSVGYQLPQKKVSPFINIGREFGFVFNSTINYSENKVDANGVSYTEDISSGIGNSNRKIWFLDLGLDYKVNKNLNVFASVRYTKSFDYKMFNNGSSLIDIYKGSTRAYDLNNICFRLGIGF